MAKGLTKGRWRAYLEIPDRLILAGGVAERLKAAVLKTVVPKGTVGSNPTSSAINVSHCSSLAYDNPAPPAICSFGGRIGHTFMVLELTR